MRIGTVDALPPIVEAVGDRLAVLFESGIRTGPDTYKALALGADAVLVGRPYVYGLALDGQAGVTHVMRTLLAELDLTLSNTGYRSHRELSRKVLDQGRLIRAGALVGPALVNGCGWRRGRTPPAAPRPPRWRSRQTGRT